MTITNLLHLFRRPGKMHEKSVEAPVIAENIPG